MRVATQRLRRLLAWHGTMQSSHTPEPIAFGRIFAVAGAAALVRAISIAIADGHARAGLLGLAANSASRHFLAGFGVALLVSWAAASWRKRGGDPLFVAVVVGVLGFRFFLLDPPSVPIDVVLASTPAPIEARHVFALLVACAFAALFAWRAWLESWIVVTLQRLACAVLLIALAVFVVANARDVSSKERPNVILIALGNLRADRLGCYGYARPTTPEIDRFARSAVRFERAFSPTPSTLAANMTLLTGLQPSAHGVTAETSLPADARTLALQLQDAGFTTVAQTDDLPWLHPRFGFARGFDIHRRVAGDAARKNAALLPLLDDLASQRFFLFVNYEDASADDERLAYGSSVADREMLARGYTGEYTGCDAAMNCGARWIAARSAPGLEPDASTARHLSDLYDAGVRGLDRELGRLFRALEERGLLENSIVVLTSDHGEAFFEHGAGLHGDLFVECTAVPLVVRLPGGGAERSLAPLVGLVDVAPTILELCGVAPQNGMQGESLASFVRGDLAPRERTFAALDLGPRVGADASFGVRKANHFLLEHAGVRALFDTSVDPREQHPLAPHERVEAWKGLAAILDREAQRSREIAARIGEPEKLAPFDAMVRRKLVRLGEPYPGDAAFDSVATPDVDGETASITPAQRD